MLVFFLNLMLNVLCHSDYLDFKMAVRGALDSTVFPMLFLKKSNVFAFTTLNDFIFAGNIFTSIYSVVFQAHRHLHGNYVTFTAFTFLSHSHIEFRPGHEPMR